MQVKVIKFNNYKTPSRAHYNDSGADIFAAESVTIPPHAVFPVKTGIGVELPSGYDAVIHCKSGLSKRGVWASNAPIDSGYRGEVHAILYNTTNSPFRIEAGEKVGQLVVRPVIYVDFVDELGTERGAGCFGSTGK